MVKYTLLFACADMMILHLEMSSKMQHDFKGVQGTKC